MAKTNTAALKEAPPKLPTAAEIRQKVEDYKKEQTEPIRSRLELLVAERELLNEAINELETLLEEFEGKKSTNKGKSSKAGELTGAALLAKGAEAIAFIKTKKGEWVEAKEISAHIGYSGSLKAALDAAVDGDQIEPDKKSSGRNRRYRIKT